MGYMLLDYFSNAKNQDAKNKHDTKGGIWPQTMCPHTTKKRSKPLAKSFRTKQSHKSSYTVFEGPLKERRGEWAKVETNASWFKVTFVIKWKSSTKGGRSTSASGWRKQKTPMVSSKRAIGVHVLLECVPLHEQGLMCDIVVLMEVG